MDEFAMLWCNHCEEYQKSSSLPAILCYSCTVCGKVLPPLDNDEWMNIETKGSMVSIYIKEMTHVDDDNYKEGDDDDSSDEDDSSGFEEDDDDESVDKKCCDK